MDVAVSEPEDRTVRLLVAYHGGSFRGFAANDGVVTVAGVLHGAVERALRGPVSLAVAGRTDAGVHAWGQVVSLQAPVGTDLVLLQRRVNSQTAPRIIVRDVEWAPVDFHARFSAVWRRYRYTIVNGSSPDPFRHDTTWHVPNPLAVSDMRLAGDVLIGEHDFSSFCRQPKGNPTSTLVRRVLDVGWSSTPRGDCDGSELVFEITGNAFCHQMVRSLVGALVDVGLGRRQPDEVATMLRARDRSGASMVAPPHGLCLWKVGYGVDPDGSLPFGS